MHASGDDGESAFPWLESCFIISFLALILHLFPAVWWALVSVVDLRQWTWRSYAVLFAIAVAVLIVAKGRQESG